MYITYFMIYIIDYWEFTASFEETTNCTAAEYSKKKYVVSTYTYRHIRFVLFRNIYINCFVFKVI